MSTHTSAATIRCAKQGLGRQVHDDNLYRAADLLSYVDCHLDRLPVGRRIVISQVPSLNLYHETELSTALRLQFARDA